MTNREILNQEFERFNCANMLSTDGLMYKAIISAMNRVRQASPVGLENGFSVASFLSAESVSVAINDINNFAGTGYSEAEIAEYDKRQEEAMKKLTMPERNKQFLAAAEKVENEIDFSKRGSIVESIFRFSEAMNGATYTELNMFYLGKNHETYDSYNHRGGSFIHHLDSIRKSGYRVYSKTRKRLVKNGNLWCSVQC
jgi:hypothetical protein